MHFYTYSAQVASGEICLPVSLIGKRYIGMAPDTRFSQWKKQNVIEQINRTVNQMDRINACKAKESSILCIDSQIVKLSPMICEIRGTDANKKVNGRKRQVLVDSEGRIWFAHIHAANQGDGPASQAFMADLI
jgi:transposase